MLSVLFKEMSVFGYFGIVLAVIAILLELSYILSVLIAKNKAVVANKKVLVAYTIIALIGIIVFVLIYSVTLTALIYSLAVLLLIPSAFTFLTPEGIRTFLFAGKGIISTDRISYEYKDKVLELYINDSGIPKVYDLGTTNINTVKMLADWYSKHDYQNPLIK